jgi:hypothetical protein
VRRRTMSGTILTLALASGSPRAHLRLGFLATLLLCSACPGGRHPPAASGGVQPSPPPLPANVLSPAPRICPTGIPPLGQGAFVPVTRLPETFNERLPRWMPAGFGIVGAWLNVEGSAEVKWWDGRCRQVWLWSKVGSKELDGPRVGPWVLRSDVPKGCGNAVLGSVRCVVYSATIGGRYFALQTIGLSRKHADRIALSVPG